MSSYKTVVHIPVTVAAGSLADATELIELLRDELALEAEKIGLVEGEIVAGEPTIDPITDAYQAPTVRSEADAAGWVDAPAFLICGGRLGAGHYAILAADPAHKARPVTRAYGFDVSADYTSFAEAEDVRDLLNRAWHIDGGRDADIETAGPAAAITAGGPVIGEPSDRTPPAVRDWFTRLVARADMPADISHAPSADGSAER